MTIIIHLDFLLLFILFFFHIHKIKINISVTEKYNLHTFYSNLLDSLIKVCILYFCWLFRLPIFILYIFIYIGYYNTYLGNSKNKNLYFYFWININFIVMVSLHLICLSCISLLTGYSLRDSFYNRNLWLIVITLTLALIDLFEFLYIKNNIHEKTRVLSNDTARLRQLIHFEYYAIAYLIFDSISCIYQLPYNIISIFLIGSCILLLLQVFLFIIHTYKIIEKAHFEAEYYRLEEERANQIKKEMELKQLAYFDSLTGTFTRRYAMEMLESMQKDCKCVTIAYIDINGLKKINDTLGHLEGDKYLITVANCLNKRLHKNDTLARIGGDEFLIISNGKVKDSLENLLSKINCELSNKRIGDFTPSFSFGIAESKDSNTYDINELLKKSDSLMYSYKTEYKRRNI